ncbi:DEAD/DEAH box helicase [Clostridium beijerinckii]|jgi:ATP-dependent RNA helicase DbpA (EC 5.99.1.-)|uniref:ATP-dependent RNA helicase DbpA n=2 Tax=Clostridium beijerinckii TaxID=1520 RepID=A0AAE2RWJ4_CLOBE|nr:DEAD/DEAH box helicase [Clostridium beijerinckii]ABR33993.1 DEAD/DEAH box helicase domain protein [Clostridium beijerinckii NCIMB 8052]AIU02468.1 DEAD/DEAH box helicase domain-containing protein [Clostridium beijerinckii ATCC 35702]MBF7811402.1 DEAD/DEAH box helicase [Clostridium beijerinckii]NOW92154.1 superfamily II DNA/RNA helicase [Clostridium beijerinckii]NRT24714.1 superfamily II DNA/RNA helicase [Clostridium beijerinckii]
MNNEFTKFKISDEILKSIEGLGYKNPSKVQEKVIPEILLNKDIIVKSQTGSGKTAAFGIPLCEKVDWNENIPQILVLTPTRELAVQVSEDITNIGRFKRIKSVSIFGKEPISEQERKLKQKTHVVVGTPGRILDHIDRGSLNLAQIKYFVIDEADEMLNMGFIGQVEGIIRRLPKKKVTMLFSATIPEEIKVLCDKYMNKPVDISINNQKLINENIDHNLYYTNYEEKIEKLNDILITEKPETVVIFAKTKENVDTVFQWLKSKGYSVNRIHGGMLQKERLSIMDGFRLGDFRILVSTDLASRGIDVKGITHVINYDLPVEKEAYVHRIGRTGRAGEKGKAISFCVNEKDKLLSEIEEFIGFKIPVYNLPEKIMVEKEKSEGIKTLKSKPKRKEEKSKTINNNITKIYLNGGKKKKIRAGDIVGAICKMDGIKSEDIGIIDVQDSVSYVDILNGKGKRVIDELKNITIKGKIIKAEKAKK